MSIYYVNNNAQSNGDHKVHTTSCVYFPVDKKCFGSFLNCQDAIQEAKQTYSQSNGCFWCSKKYHKIDRH